MLRFLFWNLAGRQMPSVVKELAESNRIDILIMAECPIDPATMLSALNETAHNYRFARGVVCERIYLFTKFATTFITPILYESDKISVRRLELPGRQKIILAAVHLPSKSHFSDASQVHECVNLADIIAESEEREGHRRTILVGDFNVNPFEEGVVAARGLNAVMSRNVALRHSRTVQGREYPFFYNPMWGHLGDRTGEPAGTFYYDKSEHVTYFWNMFDQFLIRPELAESFKQDQVRILTTAGYMTLVRDDGRPDKALYSDHLPVMLEIDF